MATISAHFNLEDYEEFPTIGDGPVESTLSLKKKKQKAAIQKPNKESQPGSSDNNEKSTPRNTRLNFKLQSMSSENILGDRFVACRIGARNNQFNQNLSKLIEHNKSGDFFITPISETNPSDMSVQYLPDLILPTEQWQNNIIVELTFPPTDDYEPHAIKRFEEAFEQALYLGTCVILITLPASEVACLTVASLVNRLIADRSISPSVLIKVPFVDVARDSIFSDEQSRDINQPEIQADSPHNSSYQSSSSTANQYYRVETSDSGHNSSDGHEDLDNNKGSQSPLPKNQSVENENQIQSWAGYSANRIKDINFLRRRNSLTSNSSIWDQWCAFRSHVNPLRNIGVCLELTEELLNDYTGRWCGEPVRLVLLKREHFLTPPGNNALRPMLNFRCQKFLTELILASSLRVGLVVDLQQKISKNKSLLASLLSCLDEFYNKLVSENPEPLRCYNDYLQLPLQPLSSNLNSQTYATFEADKVKYLKYKAAMVEALRYVQDMYGSEQTSGQQLNLMVLGAGRGPLVDCFIEAIEELELKNRCKIFALDKNSSSVVALRYKLRTDWSDRRNGAGERIDVEVVECDMRVWQPNVKADIIATELLGSFGDNELSPECIDGVWRFSTEKTISIPREYSSYIAPITSYKIYQNVIKRKQIDLDEFAFDRIYVCKLSNIHMIRQPEALFEFTHFDVSKSPENKALETSGDDSSNERHTKLVFYSQDDTICHGFGGFFQANLFGTKSISTLPASKTPKMDSWFPAYIPLEQPIRLVRGSMLEVHFWRKQSSTSVWYEWAVTQPIRSRIHSLMADGKGMPKMI